MNTKSSTTLRFLETHEVFTLDAFLESVDRYDARAGWLLNVVRDEWHPADDPLEGMRRSLGRGTFWLECRRAAQECVFVREWRLYVPSDAPLREWLGG